MNSKGFTPTLSVPSHAHTLHFIQSLKSEIGSLGETGVEPRHLPPEVMAVPHLTPHPGPFTSWELAL